MGVHPSAAEWQQYLEETLPAEQRASLEAHLEECAPCEAQLESLVRGGHGFLFERPTLARPRAWPTVPGYEFLSRLGCGGMGVVYKVRNQATGRIEALKMLRAGTWTEDHARFQAEVQTLVRLQHPGLVTLYHFGMSGEEPFFTMEYVEGRTLADRIAESPLPPRAAADLVRQLAEAMQAAHQAGVIHRDLKPANILLPLGDAPAATLSRPSAGDEGAARANALPKIADFGLARRLDVSRLTVTGAVLGTPGYLAPEQARGDAKEVGPAADVYGLGAILYAALTGRPPFLGETPVATLRQVETEEPAPPSRLQPGLPRDLEVICLKCLHKEPARRYSSATALAEDLRRFLDSKPIQARPVGWVEQTWRWCRRNPRVAGPLAALLLVLAGTSVAITSLWLRAETARKRAEANATLFEQTNMELLRLTSSEIQWTEGGRSGIITSLRQLQQMLQRELSTGNRDERLRRPLALVCTQLALHQHQSGQIEQAEDAIEMALSLWQELLTEAPNDDLCRDGLGESYVHLGLKHLARGQHGQALAAFRKAVLVLRPLHAKYNSSHLIKRILVCTGALADHLADSLRAQDNPVPVENYVTTVRECVSNLLRESDASPAEQRAIVAMMLGQVSRRLRNQGLSQEARQVAERARMACTNLVGDDMQDVLPAVFLSEAWTEIAKTNWKSPDHPQTLTALEQALAVMRRADARNPAYRVCRLLHADRWYRLGRFLCDCQRLTEAEMCFLEQYRLGKDDLKVLGQVHRELRELVAQLEKGAEAMSPAAQAARQRCLTWLAQVERDQATASVPTNGKKE